MAKVFETWWTHQKPARSHAQHTPERLPTRLPGIPRCCLSWALRWKSSSMWLPEDWEKVWHGDWMGNPPLNGGINGKCIYKWWVDQRMVNGCSVFLKDLWRIAAGIMEWVSVPADIDIRNGTSMQIIYLHTTIMFIVYIFILTLPFPSLKAQKTT